jgi:peptidyl-prolyl cis-trans isomerase C
VRQLLEELRGKAEVEVLLPGDTPRSQEPASAPRPPAAAAGAPAASPPAVAAAPAPVKAS